MDSNGAQGVEPPAEVKTLRGLRSKYLEATTTEARNAILNDAFKIHADNLWSIGISKIVSRFFWLKVVTNRVRNVTPIFNADWYIGQPAQWFIKE